MVNTAHIDAFSALPAFLEALQGKGVTLDIEDYPRIYHVVKKAEGINQLKTLLCPIIVSSREDQELFYGMFEEFFNLEDNNLDKINDLTTNGDIVLTPPKTENAKEDQVPEKKIGSRFSLDNLPESYVSFLFSIVIISVICLFFFLFLPFVFTQYPYITSLTILIIGLVAGKYIASNFKEKLVARRTESKEPPYFWKINLDIKERIDFGNELPMLAKQLRKRLPSDTPYLNINKTLKATIKNGGALHLQYNYRTKPAEYLFLIDNNSSANHQTHLFELLYRQLLKSNVYVERFFYKDDMQICWNEKHPSGLTIEQIAQRFKDYRLIIFGEGWKMINPTDGTLKDWTNVFSIWNDKVILTPKASATWSYDELCLSELFVVLPSNVDGMLQVVNHFEKLKKSNLKEWRDEYNQPEIIIDCSNIYASLDEHFSPSIQTWIAACAIYPEVTWELTLYLGEWLSSRLNKGLMSFSNIIQLSQLSWFKNGQIPDKVREQLLDILDEQLRMDINQALVDVLENQNGRNPLPYNSYAQSQFKLQLAVHKLESGQYEEIKNDLKKEIKGLIQEGVKHDFVAVESVKSPRPLDLILPKSFQRKKYKSNKNSLSSSKYPFPISLGKRIFDVVVASVSLLFLSFPLLLISLAIKLESKGPILYRSKRMGMGLKVFNFLKFRSMTVYEEGDPVITQVGKFIRRTSLDELPQLINVLKGDMSIIGNRPLPLYEAEEFIKADKTKRFDAPAGITGLWQVNKRTTKSIEGRIRLDEEYAEQHSFLMDLKIIAKTLPAMIQEDETTDIPPIQENKIEESNLGDNEDRPVLREIKIFLASSNDTKEDRRQIEILIGRMNKAFNKENILFQLNVWEDSLGSMPLTRLQNDYNRMEEDCDVFIGIYGSKIRKYTELEFDALYRDFKERKKTKLIYSFFRNVKDVKTKADLEDLASREVFKTKLIELGHFYSQFENTEDLVFQIKNQFEKMITSNFKIQVSKENISPSKIEEKKTIAPQDLESLKNELIEIVNKDIEKGIERLERILSENSKAFSENRLNNSQYTSLQRLIEQGINSDKNAHNTISQIRKSTIEFINSLQEKDIKQEFILKKRTQNKDTPSSNSNNRRFSENVKKVISRSREEAIRFGNDFIGTEHLLLGILSEENGITNKVFQSLKMNIIQFKKVLEKSIEKGGVKPSVNTGNLPLSKSSEKILKVTFLEAKALRQNEIKTEHIVLSILRHKENFAARILMGFDINYEIFKSELEFVKSKEGQEPPRFYSPEEISQLAKETEIPKSIKKVFISYAYQDESYKDELKIHLKSLARLGKIEIWDDRAIDAGDEWHDEIMKALEKADIILLLISNYFIASDFCYDIELKRALERHDAKTARVIPIIVRTCEWYELPFGKLKTVPENGRAISEWDNPDEAYTFIAQQIKSVV